MENILSTSSETNNDRWGLYLENDDDRLVKFVGFIDMPALRMQRDTIAALLIHCNPDEAEDVDNALSILDGILDTYLSFPTK